MPFTSEIFLSTRSYERELFQGSDMGKVTFLSTRSYERELKIDELSLSLFISIHPLLRAGT